MGPTLYTSGISKQEVVKVARYADDIAILAQDRHPRFTKVLLQKYTETFTKWTRRWRPKVN